MHRSAFLGSLACAFSASQLVHPSPALALDEVAIGRTVFDDLREGGEVLFDSSYYEHLNEVGQLVAKAVGSRYPQQLRFYIVKGDSPNAFAVPGGNIYVNEPLLRMAKNRDELGGVLAHESGHMVAHHVAQRLAKLQTTSILATVGVILASIAVPGAGGAIATQAADYGLGKGMEVVDANVSRHIESEADHLGADIAAATGVFNPYGMIWFFETMKAAFGAGGSNWLRSHPIDDVRIAGLREHFARNPQIFSKFTDTNGRGVEYW